MPTWSGIRHKLETEYLAKSLKGRIQYYCTSYSKSPDHNGRASIRFDGKEILRGCYWNQWLLPPEEYKASELRMNEASLRIGAFSQHNFYHAFQEFDSQSIEDSLNSSNLLVRIFAILDRRVGKRRLLAMHPAVDPKDEIFHLFYTIRTNAEELSLES